MSPRIEYLNMRRALKPASGGKVYPRRAKYAPNEELVIERVYTRDKQEPLFPDDPTCDRGWRCIPVLPTRDIGWEIFDNSKDKSTGWQRWVVRCRS